MTMLNTQFYLLLLTVILSSCGGMEKPTNSTNSPVEPELVAKPNPQIVDYIREIFQDKNGNLWFGTNG